MSWFNPLKLLFKNHHPDISLPTANDLSTIHIQQDRYVIFDLETSGLDMRQDVILSIGAVAISQNAIQLADQFEITLQHNALITPSTLVHGITPQNLKNGVPAVEALTAFMQFVNGAPLLAFHAPFDQHMLNQALKRHLHTPLNLAVFDLAEIAPMFFPNLHLPNHLDNWLNYFGLQNPLRHNAAADALASAELALIVFHQAMHFPIETFEMLKFAIHQRHQQQQTMML